MSNLKNVIYSRTLVPSHKATTRRPQSEIVVTVENNGYFIWLHQDADAIGSTLAFLGFERSSKDTAIERGVDIGMMEIEEIEKIVLEKSPKWK